MRGYFRAYAGLLLAGTVLAACSYVPDSVNPTTWKWSRLNPATWFESDQPAPPKPAQQRPSLADRPASKSDRPFPSVNDTPAKPAAPSAVDRRNLAQGLQADRDNARYTDEVLRASSAQAAPPPAAQPSPPTAMAAVPAETRPPVAPMAPVTRQVSPTPAPTPIPAPIAPAAVARAEPSPPPFSTPQPVQPTARAAAVPVPSITGSAAAPAGRAGAVPVPSVVPSGPTPSPLTAPVAASPVPPAVPAGVPRQTVPAPSASQPQAIAQAAPPSTYAAAPQALPSRPGAQVDPGGPSSLSSGFVPGGGRTPLLAAVYAQSINAQNARTISNIPPGFRQPTAQPIGQFSTNVPEIVQQSFNTALGQMPPALTPNGMTARGGPAGSVGAALIHFDEGATRASPKTRDLLVGVVEQQRQMGGRLRVVGHANGTGTREGGRRSTDVSLARAQSVARELVRLGAPQSSVVTEALGDSRPIFDESTPAGAAENRRVEIFLEP
jgi:outer membrane protein OmpA-like peptidoglycan-associated protein